jgi:5,10-methenyltetrahydrofolate synthetase
MSSPPPQALAADHRAVLRRHLLKARRDWCATSAIGPAQKALNDRVMSVLAQLEPECLGLYWPMNGEFNPMDVARAAQTSLAARLALPFARKTPPQMHFTAWDGLAPEHADECGIPSPPPGKPVVPDVVLVPCVGFTREGWRLGYGGGYFDRFLAAHPEVAAIGVGWDLGLLDSAELSPQSHDVPLTVILTESNIYGA